MKDDTPWAILVFTVCLTLGYLAMTGWLTPMIYAIDRPYP